MMMSAFLRYRCSFVTNWPDICNILICKKHSGTFYVLCYMLQCIFANIHAGLLKHDISQDVLFGFVKFSQFRKPCYRTCRFWGESIDLESNGTFTATWSEWWWWNKDPFWEPNWYVAVGSSSGHYQWLEMKRICDFLISDKTNLHFYGSTGGKQLLLVLLSLLVLLNIVTGTIVLIIIMKVEYKGEDVPLRRTT